MLKGDLSVDCHGRLGSKSFTAEVFQHGPFCSAVQVVACGDTGPSRDTRFGSSAHCLCLRSRSFSRLGRLEAPSRSAFLRQKAIDSWLKKVLLSKSGASVTFEMRARLFAKGPLNR